MRRLFLLYIGMVTTVVIVGCATTLGVRSVTLQGVNELVAEQEFGQALERLKDIPETHPEYAFLHKKLGEVRKAAAGYEQTIVKAMRRKLEQGDWSGALDHVNHGLQKYPSSAVLKQGREEVLKRRDQRIDDLKAEILLAKGRWLAEDVLLRKELARLHPSDTIGAAVRDLSQQIAEREEEARRTKHRAQQEKPQQDYIRLVGLVTQAMNKGELQKAREIASKLAKMDPSNPEVEQPQQRLNEAIAATVNQMLEQASKLYREEKIEEAEKTWKGVLELDPSNKQAQIGMERAARVLESLRLLKKPEPPSQ